jgi:hypothetical protein
MEKRAGKERKRE